MSESDEHLRLGVIDRYGEQKIAEIWLSEADFEAAYTIKCSLGGGNLISNSRDGYFDALLKLRIELEQVGMLISCFGASVDVYPSAMQLSMGGARLAYRLTLGRQALRENIVDIFESDASIIPSTVADQREFYNEWLESLGD